MQALNDYIKENRGARGKFMGNKYKKFQTEDVAKQILKQNPPHFTKPVIVEFHWVEINKKRDPDNFVFAKKFVLDGMVKAGVISNDSWNNIAGFGKETWEARPETNGGVIVTVTEVADD
jgi:Holliday junction resolvase RusA-like endonuclease